jgi:hypothetical protein
MSGESGSAPGSSERNQDRSDEAFQARVDAAVRVALKAVLEVEVAKCLAERRHDKEDESDEGSDAEGRSSRAIRDHALEVSITLCLLCGHQLINRKVFVVCSTD